MAGQDQHIVDPQTKQWLLAVGNGDQAAFAMLLRSFWNKVYSHAVAYLKSPHQAQELTQDVFIKIWTNREMLATVQDFSAYLFILSRNAIISALRKKKAEQSEFPEDIQELLLQPDMQLQYKETYNRLIQLIDGLPPARKKVFTMSRIEGKSYEEIATELGISRNGVKDHIVKALLYLRMHFNDRSVPVMVAILGRELLS